MRWIAVDEQGHVPGIAALLPIGYEVLLDEQKRIADMRARAFPLTQDAQVQDTSTDISVTDETQQPIMPTPITSTGG